MPSSAKFPSGRRALAASMSLGVLALALGLSACGSSSSANGGSTSGSSSSGAQFQARLDLAKCMRQHGINVPDPSAGGGPAGGGGFFRVLRNYPQAQVQAAQQACSQYTRKAFGQDNVSPAQREQRRQQLVKFATCMRSHGINIPDPVAGQGGGFGIRQALGSVDVNSPAFKSAMTACRSVAPQLRRPGGAGGPGPPGAPGAPGA
jgi:hypothetical protein